MAAIAEGQVFPSLLAFKKALHEWAIDRNFTPHILDSDCHRVRAGCRSSPDCPFRVRCNFSEKRGNARVTTCEDIHNCVSTSDHKVSQTIKRPEAGKLKFLIEAVPKLLRVPEELTVELITQAVERRYGQKLPLRQAQRVKRALGAKPKGPCRQCRQMGHSRKGCPQAYPAGASDPNGLSFNDLNDEDTGMHVDFDEGGHVEASHQCAHCLQPSHKCTCEATSHAATNGVQAPHDSMPQYPNTRDLNSVGHGILNGHQSNALQPNGLSSAPTHPPERSAHAAPSQVDPPQEPPSRSLQEPPTRALQEPLTRTAQESRTEAARLMQQAARLMQEAAKLNFEAARLTASWAGS